MPGPYNVLRKPHFGHPGDLAAAGLSKAEAEKYAIEMALVERMEFTVIQGKPANTHPSPVPVSIAKVEEIKKAILTT